MRSRNIFLTCYANFLLHMSVAVEFHSRLGIKAKVTHLPIRNQWKGPVIMSGPDILISFASGSFRNTTQMIVCSYQASMDKYVDSIILKTWEKNLNLFFSLNSVFMSYKTLNSVLMSYKIFNSAIKKKSCKFQVSALSALVCICHQL